MLLAGGEHEPEQYADSAGNVHRRGGFACGVRAGGHPSDARGDERRRFGIRGAAAVGIRDRTRWCKRVAADGGVPDFSEQPPDGKADGGVGGNGE